MNAEYVCIAVPLIELDTSLIHTEYLPNERVVRCRGCAMYDDEDGMCMRDPEHTGRGWCARPDGFCAWGEPRKEPDA